MDCLGSGRGLEILRLGAFDRLFLSGLVFCLALAVGLSTARRSLCRGGAGGGLGLGLGLLLADEACQVGGRLGGLADAGLGFGGGLAQDGAEDAAQGVSVLADETLSVDGVVAKVDELVEIHVSHISSLKTRRVKAQVLPAAPCRR